MSTMVPILPDSAPFSTEQRSWLNGFFAGLLGSASGTPGAQASQAVSSSGAVSTVEPPPQPEAEEDFPWHDPAMPMDDRLKLAEGRTKPRKLMAAMAQLDCGACGYLCKTYAEAIATGEESDLSLCQPGGKETAKQLKQIVAEPEADAPVAQTTVAAPKVNGNSNGKVKPAGDAPAKFDRKHPFPAPMLANERLNGAGSAKDTRFISLDLTASGLEYKAGDAVGVWPANCYEHVDDLLRLLGFHGGEPVVAQHDGRELTVREAMLNCYEIGEPGPALVKLLGACATDPKHRDDLTKLVNDEAVTGLVDEPRIVDVLARFPSVRPRPQEFVDALRKMKPRLYSISSSPRLYPDEVHLTVGVVRYDLDGRPRKGVASTYLAERVLQRQPVPSFIHPSRHFAPPSDPDAPMIMVGPGTGIAPFRAFLQDRQAQSADGDNWLFFGDRHEATDFLYRDELEKYTQDGLLGRLDTAFSRDGDGKVYVQDRMRQRAAELWSWLDRGGYFYVCGDARRMAKDVDQALKQIVAEQGGLGESDAAAYVDEMAQDGRYQRDVY